MSRIIVLLVSTLLVAASGFARAEQNDGTKVFGEFIVHYSALSTLRLSPQMASKYGIERAANRGMLNISVQQEAADGKTTAIAAEISGEAVNLTGQKSKITIREIPDLYVSYVGLYEVTAPDTYTFDLSIKPKGSERVLNIRFNQNFVAE